MKDTAIYGGLLAVTLAGAYLTWTDDGDEGRKTDVIALRIDVEDLDKVTWTEEDKTVVMTKPSDARGEYVWFSSTEIRPYTSAEEGDDADPLVEGDEAAALAEDDDDASEGDDDAPADAAPTAKPKTTTFRGNDKADELWAAFAPLYAMRKLELGADADLTVYGLEDPEVSIEIEAGGRTATVELGEESYGTRDRYARIDGELFLIDDKTIRPLQFARTRLLERKLFPSTEKEMTEVAVALPAGASRTFVQKNADDRANAYWADADTPEAKDIEAETWLGKLFRMRIRAYPPEDPSYALTPVFSYEIRTAEAAWPVEVVKGTDEDGDEHWFARAAYNRALVEVTKSLAEEPAADLDALFDGDSPEAPTEELPAEEPPVEDAPED